MRFIKVFVILFCIFLSGCASTGKFKGSGDFCGLVVDENNLPVKDFYVSIFKAGLPFGSGITNSSGIFVIENVCAGSYSVSGFRENYERLEEKKLDFFVRGKIFCFRLRSADGVFDAVEGLIKAEEFQNAWSLLEKLETGKKSFCEAVLNCYKAYVSKLLGNAKEEKKYKEKVGKNKKVDCGNFLAELEVLSEKEGIDESLDD